MRTINYIIYNFETHTTLIAKENEHYIFIGTHNETEQELQDWFGPNIRYHKGDPKDFHDIIEQLQAYYNGNLKQFNLPIKVDGTAFQKEVWNTLQNIPIGTVKTYKEIAFAIKKPKAIRAVASAIGKNPLLLLVPCHRVIGSDGALRGYRGGLTMKQTLLDLEHTQQKNNT